MSLWTPPSGTLGADTSGILTAADAHEAYAYGLRFVLRALPCPGSSLHLASPTAADVEEIHAAGLALGLYQTYQTGPCDGAKGTEDGDAAVDEARRLGYPAGLPLWADVEGGYASSSRASLIAYLIAWASAVAEAGYAPGLYHGPQPLLSGHDLGALPGIHAYWQAGALVPTPSPRGYQMLQLCPSNIRIGGMVYDLDVVQEDFRGDQASFWRSP